VKGSLYRPEDTIPARIGAIGYPSSDPIRVRFDPYPETCHRGVVHAAVLALIADMAAGWVADREAGEDWVFTSDLSLRAPNLRIPARIDATADPLRRGRGTITAEVVMLDEDGDLFAYAQAEFVRMAARPGDPSKPSMDDAEFRSRRRQPLDRPLVAMAGVEVVDPAAGVVSVPLRDELRNPAGAMQGGMVALAAQVAAEALAGHRLGVPQVVTDLDIRYLAMGRVGPVRSAASFIGPPERGTVRVDLHDVGNDDRLITAVLARVVGAPDGERLTTAHDRPRGSDGSSDRMGQD
jgi:acyl-coenzyme A thioesterase PaaI-like protein